MPDILAFIVSKYNYWAYIILMMIGLYAMIAKSNLVKKVVGMNIFQTAVMLFFISTAYKKGGTVPIILHPHGAEHHAIKAAEYINPLPHALILTAIVVSVATFGVALALAIKIYRQHRTLEEDAIRKRIREK